METKDADTLRPLLFVTVCPLCRWTFGHEPKLGVRMANSKKRQLYGHCDGCDTLMFNEVALLSYLQQEVPMIDYVLWTPMDLEERMTSLPGRWEALQKRLAKPRTARKAARYEGEDKLPDSAAFVPRRGWRGKTNGEGDAG